MYVSKYIIPDCREVSFSNNFLKIIDEIKKSKMCTLKKITTFYGFRNKNFPPNYRKSCVILFYDFLNGFKVLVPHKECNYVALVFFGRNF